MSATIFNFTGAVLDPRITFTRVGNTATRVNSSGLIEIVNADIPRFDYSPVTLASKGLLIEEQRTNLLTYSAQLDNAIWSKVALTVSADATAAPDGTTTADKIVESNISSGRYIVSSSTAMTAGVTYVGSVYAKFAGRFLQLAYQGATHGSTYYANFDLSAGTVTGSSGSGVSATISNAGDGWYRCTIAAPALSTASGGLVIAISQISNPSSRFPEYQGNGTSGSFIWGAQLEAGAFATSYIPTEASTVTRNADVATITGTNFSDFWQAVKGGTSVLATPSTVSGIRPLVQFDDGTANNIIALRGSAANPELQIVDGGAPQAQLDAGTIVANTPYSLTGWWQTNDCKARQNSGATVSDYTATIPTVTQARIGTDGTNYLNGTIATINYYDSFFGRPIYTRRKNKVFPSLL